MGLTRSTDRRSLPRQQQRFVEAWAELHRQELLANWERLQESYTL
jgi:hypothetical protein